jgi:hypothetical protein
MELSCEYASNVTDFIPSIFANAAKPMVMTLDGIEIDVIPEPPNAPSPMVVTLYWVESTVIVEGMTTSVGGPVYPATTAVVPL